jgi:hypothetical protein
MNSINASTLQSGNLKIDPSVANILAAKDDNGNDDKDQTQSSFPMLAVAGVALVALLLLSRSKK